MTSQLIHHPDLVGVSHLLATVTPSRLFASSGDTQRILAFSVAPPALTYAGESALMDAEPGALVNFASLVWVVCSDGTLRTFSVADLPVQASSYSRQCYTNRWLLSYSSILIVPGPCGTLLTVNSSGTVLARAEGILDEIQMAAVDSSNGYVYLFDGRGNGLVLIVNGTSGAITMGDYFEPVNCTDIQGALVDGDSLVIVARDRRVVYDLTDAAVPVLSDTDLYRDELPTSTAILSASHRYLAAQEPPAEFPVPWRQGPSAVNGGLIVGLPGVGSLLYENPALDEGGNSITIPTIGAMWTSRTISQVNPWTGVAYGAGVFVAVAQSGTNQFFSSTDGITWTARVAPAVAVWQGISFVNNKFIAVSTGGADIATSSDGITWTLRAAPNAGNWTSVAYGAGTYVAVSYDALADQVMTSTDAITWTARTAASTDQWYKITFGAGLFVAVSLDGTVMSSPDGITWTLRTAASASAWTDITFGGSLFVAVSSAGTIMTSANGITWTARTAPSASSWNAVAYGGSLFVAVSSTSAAMTSPDGITWTARTSISMVWVDLVFGSTNFVAVAISGSASTRIMTSP